MRYRLILKYVVSGVVILLIFFHLDLPNLIGHVRHARLPYVIIGALIALLITYLRAARWRILARREVPSISLGQSAVSLLAGSAIGILTPGRIGEISRPLFMGSGDRLKLAGLVVVDKVLDLVPVVTTGAIGAAWYWSNPAYLFILILPCVTLLVLFLGGKADALAQTVIRRLPGSMRKSSERMSAALHLIDRPLIGRCLALAACLLVSEVVQFYLLLISLQNNLTPAVMAVIPIVYFTNVVPLTIGGLGPREAVAIWLLRGYGVPPESAVCVALFAFAVNIVIPAMIGLGVAAGGRRLHSNNALQRQSR